MRVQTKTVRYMKKTPGYKLTAHDNKIVAQHHYTGHTHGIIYFLQSVHNPRCGDYCRELSRHASLAKAYNTVMVAIAPDPVAELARAHQEWQLAFPLLSDPGSETARRYGLYQSGWFRSPRVRPALVVHDKYGIAYLVAVAENPEERAGWEEMEEILKRFPRG